ncbi:MAG: hypothetical protein J5599_02375, partial [Spirochaetales bacterium]|nr:hypothetical protein [Spirochaetales bacterium]
MQAKPEVAQPEKKKVVVIKKKPVVVVKTQAAAPVVEQKAPETPAVQTAVQEPVVQSTSAPAAEVQAVPAAAPEQSAAAQTVTPAASQTVYRRPVIGGAPVQKKVIKKSNVPQSTINMGPVIISGDNLPPIMPKTEARPAGTSRPVGSVGGVTYGRDGQRIQPNRTQGNFQRGNYGQGNMGQGGFRAGNAPQGYTPRSAQQGNNRGGRPGQGGFNRDGQRPGFGQKPGFGGKGAAKKGGFSAPAEALPVDSKNRRVYNKGKDKDRRDERTDEELELKSYGKKKSADSTAAVPKSIDILSSITVSDLARKMNIKASEIISKLFG